MEILSGVFKQPKQFWKQPEKKSGLILNKFNQILGSLFSLKLDQQVFRKYSLYPFLSFKFTWHLSVAR